MVTLADLRAAMPHTPAAVVKHLNDAMEQFGIDTPLREAAFLAQCGHESNQFREMVEEASGEAYEGRTDLGNVQPGDGVRFKGRGCIEITGRDNYAWVSKELGVDFVSHPELLELPEYAFKASALWWKHHGLNERADDGDFLGITRVVNGKRMNGLHERQTYYEALLKRLGCVLLCEEHEQ